METATFSAVDKITVQDILDARERIAPHVHKTPLLPFHASWDSTSEKKRVSKQMEPRCERKRESPAMRATGARNWN